MIFTTSFVAEEEGCMRTRPKTKKKRISFVLTGIGIAKM